MSENYLTKENIVLIANGKFPTHEKPLEIIKKNFGIFAFPKKNILFQSFQKQEVGKLLEN